ncbi:MAG: putative ABC transport system permease protein, partial [Pseudomonas sp.]
MGIFAISLQALLSHWRRHPLQFFSIFTGLWLATMLWTGVQALNSQARADYARASSIISNAAPARLVARQGLHVDQLAYIQLRL